MSVTHHHLRTCAAQKFPARPTALEATQQALMARGAPALGTALLPSPGRLCFPVGEANALAGRWLSYLQIHRGGLALSRFKALDFLSGSRRKSGHVMRSARRRGASQPAAAHPYQGGRMKKRGRWGEERHLSLQNQSCGLFGRGGKPWC